METGEEEIMELALLGSAMMVGILALLAKAPRPVPIRLRTRGCGRRR
jgi:hypothetical protein